MQIARALMPDPELLLLDEPAAGLDLGGREDLLRRLAKLAGDPKAPMMVLVTHHVEEVPDGFTHAMLLRRGSVLAAGPIEEVFTARNLSRCFGVRLEIEHRQSRWTARPREAPALRVRAGASVNPPVGRHTGLEGWLAGGGGPVNDGAVGDHEGGSVPGAGHTGSAPIDDDPALMSGPPRCEQRSDSTFTSPPCRYTSRDR